MKIAHRKLGPASAPRKKSGHTLPRQPTIGLDEPGWLHVGQLLYLFGISHSTLYRGLKSGRYPDPDGWDGNRPYWRTSTIAPLLLQGAGRTAA